MGMYLLAIVMLSAAVFGRWTPERAKQWYDQHPWLVGCNFIPSTASNELEMWQAETFDLATIERELEWAEDLGFNTVRVFLHYLLWESDKEDLFKRMDQFLTVATRHHISTMFVLNDDCWDPNPTLGKQPEPVPHVHNSRWVKSPGVAISHDLEKQNLLEPYIKDVLKRFANDPRVLMWDLFNEPGNGNEDRFAVPQLEKSFVWAREVDPSQPLFAAVWTGEWKDPNNLSPLNKIMLTNSDIIVFHNYGDLNSFKHAYESLLQFERPIICNEYMARPAGSTFHAIMPFMKEHKIGAYNWGFVSGKTQTIYPWDSWVVKYTEEPKFWFHDILRQDGTPYDAAEVALIKSLTH